MKLFASNPIVREMRKDRVFGLDILRALAIFYVLIGHAAMATPMKVQIIHSFIIWIDGVTLFFVLSGFLIGRILIKTIEKEGLNTRSLLKFWWRRWLRTLPAYFTVLLLLAVLYDKFWGNKRLLLKYALFIQNFNTPQPHWFAESWSLSIEEWFYLLTPVVLFLFLRVFKADTRKAILTTCLFVIIAFPLYRLYKYSHTPFQGHSDFDLLFRTQVTTRLDSIMYGVLGAYVYHYHRGQWSRYKNKLAITGLVIILVTRSYDYMLISKEALYSSVLSFSLASLGVLLVLPYFEHIKKRRGKVAAPITFLSIISYSAYLLNFTFVGGWLLPHLGFTAAKNQSATYLLFISLSIISATLLYLLIEYPFLQLRNKMVKDTAQTDEKNTKKEADYSVSLQ